MNPAEIRAELRAIERERARLRQREDTLEYMLRGIRVEVEIFYHNDTEPEETGFYTLDEAFDQVGGYRYYEDEGEHPSRVCVGGATTTWDEWKFDRRNSDRQHWLDQAHAAAIKEQERAEREEAKRLREIEQAKMARITKHGPMVAAFSGGVQVSDWQPRSKGYVTLRQDQRGPIDELVYTLPGGMLSRVPIATPPSPGTDIVLSDWPLG